MNISKSFSALTNAIICKMAFSRKYSDEDVTDGFDSLIREILLLVSYVNIGDHIQYLVWINHLRGINRRLKNMHKKQDHFLEKVIEEHINVNANANAQHDPSVPQDIVDVLLVASIDKDMELQITRDNIKVIGFVVVTQISVGF